MNTFLLPLRSLSLRCLTFRPFRPQSPSCLFPITAFARYFSRLGRRVYPPGRSLRSRELAVTRSGVHRYSAGSPTGLAESGSLSYGLDIHLQLLSTSPRGDAVTIGYRFRNVKPRGDFHPTDQTLSETHRRVVNDPRSYVAQQRPTPHAHLFRFSASPVIGTKATEAICRRSMRPSVCFSTRSNSWK